MPRDVPRDPYLFKEVRSDPVEHLILPAIPPRSTSRERDGIRRDEFKNRLEPPTAPYRFV